MALVTIIIGEPSKTIEKKLDFLTEQNKLILMKQSELLTAITNADNKLIQITEKVTILANPGDPVVSSEVEAAINKTNSDADGVLAVLNEAISGTQPTIPGQ